MAYLYRHIRQDNGQIFYIGIGSDSNYRRAKTKQSRNPLWHNIVNKTKRIIEIMIDEISWEEAQAKEIEFIAMYGRRDMGNGPLVNMSNGGDGCLGKVVSEETKEKLRRAKLGTKHSEETKAKMKGRVMSEYQKNKISINSSNYRHSEETKKKMRGRALSQEMRDKIAFINRNRIRTPEEKEKMRLSALNRKK